MSDELPRILPKEFTEAYLDELEKFRIKVFGADMAIPAERIDSYRKAGVYICRAYGVFSVDTVDVQALGHGYLISEAEYQLIREGKRDERDLLAWQPDDGDAVLWISAIISYSSGGATKILGALLDDIESHPHLARIKTVAAFVTGAKGYMFAEACGMKRRPEMYDGDMPFFEAPFSPATLANAADMLTRTWNISDIKVSIEKLRELTNGNMPLRYLDTRFASR